MMRVEAFRPMGGCVVDFPARPQRWWMRLLRRIRHGARAAPPSSTTALRVVPLVRR
jgi:hypothetical protein